MRFRTVNQIIRHYFPKEYERRQREKQRKTPSDHGKEIARSILEEIEGALKV